jgi:antirestriction protein ArdC
MNKAYQVITDRIIDGLKLGKIAWRRPWSKLYPYNAVTKKAYRGINILMLGLTVYTDPRWMTFKQIEDKGGKVRKGEKGTPIVFWTWLEYADKDGKPQTRPLLRYYYVWNVEQTEGLNLPPVLEMNDNEPITDCESLVANMPNRPDIRHEGNRACYIPNRDLVRMPDMKLFESPTSYYETLFHELGHSTGHTSRLNRPGFMDCPEFGTCDYSKEELVAELTSAFLCQAVGIDNDATNTQAYINGWLTKLANDPQAIVWAAGRASKAADYIQGKGANLEASEAETEEELVTA